MGTTVIYLEDKDDCISITSEHLGDEGKSSDLATRVIQSLLLFDDVFYTHGNQITARPFSPIIQ
jgi:hypothetical protein